MKKITTLIAVCGFVATALAQNPFTITANNFPLFGYQLLNGPNAPNGNNLIPAPNGNWDLSAYHASTTSANNYVAETDPFYTNAGVDVYLSGFKSLTSALGYYVYNEFDFNTAGVFDKGVYIDPQAYGLGALTGNSLDSLTIPFQGAIFQPGRQVMQFPATYQSGWHSENRRTVDFNLTVAAAGLNKAPCKHIFTIFRTDTIIGWGKLRVYVNGAPSAAYEVLIDRSKQYAVDSFLLGGVPAPPALLIPFGMSQGQQTDAQNRYTVYRQGNSTPLAIILFSNANFTTPSNLYFDTENLSTTAVKSPVGTDFSTLLFPNPSTGGDLTLQVVGKMPSLSAYDVVDLQGRTVQSGAASLDNGMLHLRLGGQLANGSYLLRLLDDRKQTVITEQFMIEQ